MKRGPDFYPQPVAIDDNGAINFSAEYGCGGANFVEVYAGQAMQVLFRNALEVFRLTELNPEEASIARQAFAMARAMEAERLKSVTQPPTININVDEAAILVDAIADALEGARRGDSRLKGRSKKAGDLLKRFVDWIAEQTR